MKEEANWIIIDVRTRQAMYGQNKKAMRFTTEEVAMEIATQLYEKSDEFLVVDIKNCLTL